MDLGVALLEADGGQALGLGRLSGPGQHWARQVDGQHGAAGPGRPGGVATAQAVAAADVEYPLAGDDGGRGHEPGVVGLDRDVEPLLVGGPVLAVGPVPIGGLVDVGDLAGHRVVPPNALVAGGGG